MTASAPRRPLPAGAPVRRLPAGAPMRRLIVGSNNPHKTGEITALLADLDVEVLDPAQCGIDDEPAETGATFHDNALIKARFFAGASGLACLADDSGLEVDALGGRPGVLSSRYAPTDPERIARVLEEMCDVDDMERGARFVCAAALVSPPPDAREIVEIGSCRGAIALEPRGHGGFGYDPVFHLPDLGKTMAELAPDEKNALSHRGRALAAIRPHLVELLRT